MQKLESVLVSLESDGVEFNLLRYEFNYVMKFANLPTKGTVNNMTFRVQLDRLSRGFEQQPREFTKDEDTGIVDNMEITFAKLGEEAVRKIITQLVSFIDKRIGPIVIR